MSDLGTTDAQPRGWRSSKVIAAVLALLSVAVMAAALRVSENRLDFQVITGQVDRPVAIRGGELSVGKVRVGNRLTREGVVDVETTGMFVVVEIRLAATGNRDITLGSARLLTRDGRNYSTYESALVKAVSGFRTVADARFEVDPARIDDLTIQIWENELISGYQQRTRIHLGITPDNADAWRAAGRDRGVEPRRLEESEAIP